jgi:hypothetical protein
MFRFIGINPTPWHGRYARIPGDTTVVHVRHTNTGWWPVIDWSIGHDTAHCRMVEAGDVVALVDAVLAGKRALGVSPGGAFLVNEFGQVLVPASDSQGTRVVIVGECSGPFTFKNPFEPGTVFDLGNGAALNHGDRWDRPYVGIPHNLSASGEVYFKLVNEHGIDWLKPRAQDAHLISALRALRPWGAVRFIVTVGGLVVTKVEPAWEPRYVGRINPSRWFAKEV